MNYKIYFLLLIHLLVGACSGSDTSMTKSEEATALPVTVDILLKNERIKMGTIQKKTIARTVACTGQIDIPPTEVSTIHSKIAGQVRISKYLPGDYVKKGVLLAIVENPQLIEKQRIFLETKANLNFAKKDFDRKKILKAGQATPEKVVDETQNRYELLQATYKGLKKELELLGIHVDVLETEHNFQSTINIYASQSGYIHQIMVNQGQMISPETALMNIADINHLHLELQLLSKDIGAISKGQQVNFTIPNSSEVYQATVVKINPVVFPENATLQVHCHIDHTDKSTFVAGLFVNAEIQSQESQAEGLPINAVLKEGEDYFAYKIVNNAAIKTPLTNPSLYDDFVVFDDNKDGQWIIEGAYYIE